MTHNMNSYLRKSFEQSLLLSETSISDILQHLHPNFTLRNNMYTQ